MGSSPTDSTRSFGGLHMNVDLTYTCKDCGSYNKITSFWKWFWTPHLGSKKFLKCDYCSSEHFMKRENWTGPKWLDWPKNK